MSAIALERWIEQARYFEFNGQRIAYWTTGEGEPLLLIHGFPSASWDWHQQWQALAERYQVIACDMLGFGLSAKPQNHRYCLLEQADLQQALLKHLAIDQPLHVLAHDYGDSVAQELLARHQQAQIELASCVFLNGGLFPETHKPVLAQRLLLSRWGRLLVKGFSKRSLEKNLTKIFGANTAPKAQELEALWALLQHNNGVSVLPLLIQYMPQRRVLRERWLAAMQQCTVPLRVIDGAADPISGVHMVQRYRELIESADTVLLEGIGHYPQLEAPQAVLDHYLQFRQRLEARRCNDVRC